MSLEIPISSDQRISAMNPNIYGEFNNSPVSDVSESQFYNDFVQIDELQRIFDTDLGITEQVRRNYNPVLAYWKYRNLKSPQDIELFKTYEIWQVMTSLYERNRAARNSINYSIGEDGTIYNELFPDEPFENVLLRGLAYQREHGTVEPEREQAEYDGWKQISEILKNPDTPLHTKAIVMSGPGIAEGSMYKDNFIDIYEALEDPVTRKRFIKMTRNASGLNYDQYYDIAQGFEPDYFNGITGTRDAWHLGKPIYRIPQIDSRTVEELVDQVFGICDTAMSEEDMLAVREKVYPFAKHFVETGICGDVFDPKNIAFKWNSVLAKNDIEVNKRKNKKAESNYFEANSKHFASIHDEVSWLGRQQVQTVAAACGASAGFNLNTKDSIFGGESSLASLTNSVAKFGLNKDKYGELTFDCPKCHYENKRPYGKLVEKCQHCGSTEVACKNEKDD